jgi:hypothetical protein
MAWIDLDYSLFLVFLPRATFIPALQNCLFVYYLLVKLAQPIPSSSTNMVWKKSIST